MLGRRSFALVFAFAASWPALAAAAIEKGPVLGDVTKDGVTLRWFTDQPSIGTVTYGISPTLLTSSMSESTASTDHEVTLTGLEPFTQYYYAIESGTDKVEGSGLTFRTAPDPCTPFRFMVFGDTRGATPLCDNFTDWAKVSMMIAAQQPDFVVGTGDYVYAGVTPACWDHWFDQAGAMLRRTPFFGVIGNHEYKTGKYSAEDDPGLLAYSRWFPVPAGPEIG